MDFLTTSITIATLTPPLLMLISALLCVNHAIHHQTLWKAFSALCTLALISTLSAPLLQIFQPSMPERSLMLSGLIATPSQAWLTVLVQFLGTVIGMFSCRYLQGESGQARYIAAFSGVLAAVHILLLADHWLLLIVSWAMIGLILQQLLCFYPERPFAMLAAHKKFIADRLADVLLIIAAILAWQETGSGSLSALYAYVSHSGMSLPLHISAVCMVLAVIMRTALFPVHGWLIQVMEAPTPVSALLHAGVVNLAGFVLIRFSPLLEAADFARWLLVIFGLITSMLAGLVMLTRVSIKVRLAWSTVAQMGFMLLECGLGLYTLAMMHLLGHSLYKAHTFLSASSIVQQNKLQQMHGKGTASFSSVALAPVAAIAIMMLLQHFIVNAAWPWWWSAILALAWSPLLWTPYISSQHTMRNFFNGAAMIIGLTMLAYLLHKLPFGTSDMPDQQAGTFALLGMALIYLALAAMQVSPRRMAVFHRWSYAGFYVDEAYTRLALKLWPIDWASADKPDINRATAN